MNGLSFAAGVLAGIPLGGLLGILLYMWITKAEQELVAELEEDLGVSRTRRL